MITISYPSLEIYYLILVFNITESHSRLTLEIRDLYEQETESTNFSDFPKKKNIKEKKR